MSFANLFGGSRVDRRSQGAIRKTPSIRDRSTDSLEDSRSEVGNMGAETSAEVLWRELQNSDMAARTAILTRLLSNQQAQSMNLAPEQPTRAGAFVTFDTSRPLRTFSQQPVGEFGGIAQSSGPNYQPAQATQGRIARGTAWVPEPLRASTPQVSQLPHGAPQTPHYTAWDQLPPPPPPAEFRDYTNHRSEGQTPPFSLKYSINQIPVFDGSPECFWLFADAVREAAQMHGPQNERYILRALAQKLQGSVRKYVGRLTEYASVEALLEDFTHKYGDIRIARRIIAQIKGVKQGLQESVADYGERMEFLRSELITVYNTVPNLHPHEKEAHKGEAYALTLRHFMRGLRESLKYETHGRQPQSLREAIKIATEVEETEWEHKNQSTEPWENYRVFPSNEATIMKFDSKPKCTHCSGTGHEAQHCIKRRMDTQKCEYCDRKGHLVGDCLLLLNHIKTGKTHASKVEGEEKGDDKEPQEEEAKEKKEYVRKEENTSQKQVSFKDKGYRKENYNKNADYRRKGNFSDRRGGFTPRRDDRGGPRNYKGSPKYGDRGGPREYYRSPRYDDRGDPGNYRDREDNRSQERPENRASEPLNSQDARRSPQASGNRAQ